MSDANDKLYEQTEMINHQDCDHNETLSNQMHVLDKRVRELRCMYRISDLAALPGISLNAMIQGIVDLMPSSWQYPEITCARIIYGDCEYKTNHFRTTDWSLKSDIVAGNDKIGAVEVYYLDKMPEIDEGPFLEEERTLIEAVAKRLGETIQYKETRDRLKILERAVENSLDGIVVCDINGNIKYTNSAWETMHGYDKNSGSADHLSHYFNSSQIDEEVTPLLVNLINDVTHEREIWHTRKDGTVFPTLMSCAKMVDEDDNSVEIVAVTRDITERKHATEEHARLASIIDQAAEIIIITDLDGFIEYVNPAFELVTGYKSDEIIGINYETLANGTDKGIFHKEIQSILKHGVTWSGQLAHRKKNGKFYNEEVSVLPIKDPSGTIINYVSIGRDVTEQLTLERQLRQAQKLESIGQLSAGIAHEINTPMQYVGDNTEFLSYSIEKILDLTKKYGDLFQSVRDGEIKADKVKSVEDALQETNIEQISTMVDDAIKESLEGINRVVEIVKAMKDFSHMGSGEKTVIDINKAIKSTVTIARNEWKYVSELETDLDSSIPGVNCIPGEINQVILNLITNAAHTIGKQLGDKSAEKGLIKISTRLDGDWVEIRCKDTGTGIPLKIQDRIFDPFFTTKEVGKGTGQGLSIAHSVITEKHGGSITFETQQGKGTCFIVRLPLKSDEDELEAEDSE